MIGKIKGTGAYVPERAIHNDELARIMNTNDEWIRERTGIVRRHVAFEETTVSMSVKAARKALENAGVSAEELDMILVSTVSSNLVLPSTACAVQAQLGAGRAACFDLNAACTGFLFALNTVQAYFHAGVIKCALVIGAESLSNLLDWSDRGTAILFGDGAGAAVLTAGEGDFPKMVIHSDGTKGPVLTCDSPFAHGREIPFFAKGQSPEGEAYIRMSGQEVFKFAVRQVPLCIAELLDQCGIKVEDIDLFLLHQANQRIVEGIARRLRADLSRFPMNMAEYGNTSSASIPILLDECNRSGRLKKGMKLVLAGFGAGLSWGATYMEWNEGAI
ncbi:MAG: ketoacyl-ACP synthase III [Candidatus Gastranaerophilales bacterium]|nr:ketoacyl-ACP synthase III [Candidatus Gastranaerophilales bacterium]